MECLDRQEVIETLRSDLLELFLGDASIPAAVFHSRALGRDFVLARDEPALEALTEADRVLPVLFFAECPDLLKGGLEGLRGRLGAVLDTRQVFGPAVTVQVVEARDA